MKINLELSFKSRKITITSLRWDKANRAWMCGVDKNVFASRYRVRLTAVIYWLRTGKRLKRSQIIHHIDHAPTNNLFINLAVQLRATHARHHHVGRRCSAETRRLMSSSAIKWARTSKNRKLVSERAKRQHREKNFGRHTWRSK